MGKSKAKSVKVTEDPKTVNEVEPVVVKEEEVEEVVPTAPEVPVTPVANPGADIAAAITQGLKDAKGDKTIKITVDKSVTPRFTVVKSKRTGDVMLRENHSGVLSKVQLESLEEKEASIQGEEVEEV